MLSLETWQWLSIIGFLLVHTAMVFRWGSRMDTKMLEQDKTNAANDKDHDRFAMHFETLRQTDATQGQLLAVSSRLLDVHAEELQRLRDWKHDDFAQWSQRLEARVANLELDRARHGDPKQETR